MVMLSSSWRDVRSDVFNILFDAFTNDLFTDNCVEEDIELNYNPLEVVLFVGVLLGHEEPILFLEDVLNLTNDVGSPNDLPVLFGVQRLFVEPLFEVVKQEN
jgi:hypothetical protein